jgi:hypothetical protein
MIPDWKRIRDARHDVTDWVIHWTRQQPIEEKYKSAFQVLQHILQCGYLKPTFASRELRTVAGKVKNTIQGPHQAVCFTDQPLWAFIQSCKVSTRYSPYGIAFEKRPLFEYGGRPVIYGDTSLLSRLCDEDKYLWVRYDPVPSTTQIGDYPLDWTHEREWRARVRTTHPTHFGYITKEGVPLVLPPIYVGSEWSFSLLQILVKTLKEATELREWLAGLPEYEGTKDFMKHLYTQRTKIKIIPLDFISERLKDGDDRWARLETLPYSEIP